MFLKWIKKNKLKIITTGICSIAMALFTIVSFSCKTYAYTIDTNGNLVGENLFYDYNPDSSSGNVTYTYNNTECRVTTTSNSGAAGSTFITYEFSNLLPGHYYFKIWYYNYLPSGIWFDGGSGGTWIPNISEIDFDVNSNGNLRINIDIQKNVENIFRYISLSTRELEQWEPYGTWYSSDNYDALQEDYDTLSNVKNKIEQDYKTLVNVNNYGMWAYLTGYVWDSSISLQGQIQFRGVDAQGNYVSSIKVPDRNSYTFTYEDLMRSGLLEVGGILNTTTLEEFGTYESNLRYNINCIFNHLPTNSFYMRFENVNNFTIRIMDYNNREVTLYKNSDIVSFTYQDIYEIDNQFGNEIYAIYINNSAYSNNDTMGQFITYNTNTDSYNLGYADARQNYRYYIEEVEEQAQEINNLRDQINRVYNDRYYEGYQEGYNIGTSEDNALYNMVIRSLQIHQSQYLNKYLILIY